jgi:MinD-like ATPase involved in chromosome partitioning or flagellar assembly
MIPITVFSSKGGVGKTIISINMAYCLAKRGIRTILVDTDVQNNVALYLGEEIREGLSEFVLGNISARKIIHETEFGFSYVSTGLLSMLQTVKYLEEIDENKIQSFLIDVKAMDYEVVIFDTPPGYTKSLEATAMNSIVMLGVLQADPTSFAALKLLSEILKKIRTKNPKIKTFFVLNMLEPTEVSRDFEKLLTHRLRERLLGTLPYDMNVKMAVGNCQPVEKQNPQSPFAILLDRIISNLFAKL